MKKYSMHGQHEVVASGIPAKWIRSGAAGGNQGLYWPEPQ